MFDGIGNINSYVKMQSMWGKFTERRDEGLSKAQKYSVNSGAEAAIVMAKKMSTGATDKEGKPVDDPEMMRIVSKLNGGQELSALEMEYLRKNSEGIYQKAKRVAYDRDQFRQRLKSCKTPEEVESLRGVVTAAVASGSADGGGGPAVGGSTAEQLAQSLPAMLYRALEEEFRRALRRDTLTKTKRDE